MYPYCIFVFQMDGYVIFSRKIAHLSSRDKYASSTMNDSKVVEEERETLREK